MTMNRPGTGAPRRPRRATAAVELAVTLPLILLLLAGLWESARIIEVQQVLLNAAREGARQAGTGEMGDAGVRQGTLQYLRVALGDASGTMTRNAVVTVENLTHPGTDSTAATSLDQLQVTVTIPYKDVRWTGLKLATDDATTITGRATWVSLVDAPYPSD